MPVSGIFTQFALFVGIKIGWSFTHLIRRVCSSVKRGDAYLCSKIAVSDRIQTPAKTQSSKTPKSESFYRTHIVQMWIMFMNSICLHHKIVQSLHLARQRQSQAQTFLSSHQLSAELLSGSSFYGRCSNSSIKLRMLHLVLSVCCHNNTISKQKIMNRNLFFMCNICCK